MSLNRVNKLKKPKMQNSIMWQSKELRLSLTNTKRIKRAVHVTKMEILPGLAEVIHMPPMTK